MLTKRRGTEMRVVAPFAVGAVLLGTVACGDHTSGRPTTAPSPIPPSVTGITIGGPDAVRTGFASDYTVTASMSDGSSQDVSASASCTSSDPSVASIAAPCHLTGTKHGSTTVTVSSQGRTTSKTVNVVNNYGGSWDGVYWVRTCDATGILLGWCAENLDGESSFSLILTQSGSGQDQISGTISARNIIGNEPLRVSGGVTNDGRLLLSGSTVINTYNGVAFQLSISDWDSIVDANTVLSGRAQMSSGEWDLSLVAIGANGHAFQHQTIPFATQLTSEPPPVKSGIRATTSFAGAFCLDPSTREHKTVHEKFNEF